MGTEYDSKLVVGFEVPSEWVYQSTIKQPEWCSHPKESDALFCPQCGSRKPSAYSVSTLSSEAVARLHACIKYPKTELAKMCSLSEVQWDLGYEEGVPLAKGVHLCEYRSNSGFKKILVGTLIASVSDGRYADQDYSVVPMPEYRSESELVEVLKEHGIPFVEGSYGLHKMLLAC